MRIDWRPYLPEGDFTRLIDLVMACRETGQADSEFRSVELRSLLTRADFDVERLTHVGVNESGRLVAFGMLWRGQVLGTLIREETRGTADRELLAWAERVVLDAGQRLRVMCRDDDRVLLPLLEQRGYGVIERELRMTRDLHQPIPAPALPSGFALDHVRSDEQLAEWVDLYNEAFGATDIPGPTTVEHWRSRTSDPDYDPALHIIVVNAHGTIASTCYCSLSSEENQRASVREGRTEPIATRSAFRRMGLARAALLAGMRALRARSMDVALLTTDASNLGAHRLYQSVGYRHQYSALWLESPPLPDAGGNEKLELKNR